MNENLSLVWQISSLILICLDARAKARKKPTTSSCARDVKWNWKLRWIKNARTNQKHMADVSDTVQTNSTRLIASLACANNDRTLMKAIALMLQPICVFVFTTVVSLTLHLSHGSLCFNTITRTIYKFPPRDMWESSTMDVVKLSKVELKKYLRRSRKTQKENSKSIQSTTKLKARKIATRANTKK